MEIQNLPWYGQFAVFLLIGAILFCIFYFAWYQDNESKIKNMVTEIEGLEKEIRGLEKKQSRIKQMEEEVKAKEAVLEKLKEILPETKEISQILKKIQSIITNARLRIQKWTTQKPRKKEVYIEHPINITIDGNYHNLGMFFDQLSKLKKIFTVNQLSISPRGKMTRAFTIKAKFTASTYTFRETKKANKKKKSKKRSR